MKAPKKAAMKSKGPKMAPPMPGMKPPMKKAGKSRSKANPFAAGKMEC